MIRTFIAFIVPFILQVAAGQTTAATVEKLAESRQSYVEAVTAIRRGRLTDYEQLRNDLDEYPLSLYLDYYKLSGNPRKVRPADARVFISQSADSPLPNRFLSVYLNKAGRDRRWDDFLQVKQDEPNEVALKCYYLRARLAEGDKPVAWEGAERLWVHGESRPKECDPLFDAWLKSGELGDKAVWGRMVKAFEARERSLMIYVARKGSAELQPWSDKLIAVYRNPQKMRNQSFPADSAYSADIVSLGLAFLARYSPAKALSYWQAYQGQLQFDPAQMQRVEYAITLRSLFAKEENTAAWIDDALVRLQDDKLTEIRLRWLLEEADWEALLATIPKLSETAREETVWRYWAAVADESLGRVDQAKEQFASVAQERDYYGFLASDKLGSPYSFNNQPLILLQAEADRLARMPSVQRVEELLFHEEDQLAHSEWFNTLDTREKPIQKQLAVLAGDRGWHRMAIDAASHAKAWDALNLRFPLPYQETFDHYSTVQRVPATELMAIARRESAFFPGARSPVGARGLMQIMPATGKQVASSLGRKHSTSALYEVEHNVQLGSAYYRQLLDRFSGNRIFALAAYNAGPHRVDRWKKNSNANVAVEVWVETIPFRETRNYVQAVLSYNVVLQHMQGNDISLLTIAEQQAQY
ncbi:MAG: transglycosylase SLT domain-containing protein [Halioglobus sp.]